MPTAVQPYQFYQSTPSMVWEVQHNLGVYPVVDVMVNFNGTLTKIIPQGISVIDLNRIEIQFSTAYSGQARMV